MELSSVQNYRTLVSHSASPFLETAATQEYAWFRALEGALDPAVPDLLQLTRECLPAIQRRNLARVLHALRRENLLPDSVLENGSTRIELDQLSGSLLAVGFTSSDVMMMADLDSLTFLWSDGKTEEVKHPARLLELTIAQHAGDRETWAQLSTEITDSMLNETLALVTHNELNRTISAASPPDRKGGFIAWLQNNPAVYDVSLFLEQWCATGHPLHIVPKARLGLSPDQALNILPEFQPRVAVRLAALRKSNASWELTDGIRDVQSFFSQNFAEWHTAWCRKMADMGCDPDQYIPLPVHPWHSDFILKEQCRSQLDSDSLMLLDGPAIETGPTLSVRSVVPADDPSAPTLKLALGLRLTSGVRTISPRSCHMGPRICCLLRKIIEGDAQLRKRAGIVDELIGVHYSGEPEVEKLLSFIGRRSVQSCLESGEVAIPSAALPLTSPFSGLPLLAEISNSRTPAESLNAFQEYVGLLLSVTLRTYLVYGIALEAHGQNTLAVFSRENTLKRVLFRDFGGIRIHEPSLRALGLELDVHPDQRTVVQEFTDHRFWIMHRVYQCHIGHIAHGFSAYFGIPEARYWQEAGTLTRSIFMGLKDEVPAERWQAEYRVFLENEWQAKGSLQMRLLNQVRDVPINILNPFKG